MYYEDLIDGGDLERDLESILEDHKRSTITSYGTRTSSIVTATKPEKTALDNAVDDKDSGAVKNAVNKSKVGGVYFTERNGNGTLPPEVTNFFH